MNLLSLKMKKGYFYRSYDDFLTMQRQRGRNMNGGNNVNNNNNSRRRLTKQRPKPLTNNRFVKAATDAVFPMYRRTVGFPREQVVLLKYSTDFTLDASAALFTYSYRLLNGIWDPDDGGSGNDRNYAFFNNYAEVYDSYVCQKVHYRISIVNQETFPVVFCLCPSNFDLSSVLTSGAAVQDLAEQYLGKKRIITGTSGLNTTTVTGTIDLAHLLGDFVRYSGEPYRGFFNSNPSVLMYLFFGIIAEANLTNGVLMTIEFTSQIKFSSITPAIGQTSVPPLFDNRPTMKRPNLEDPE
jgi:hypothetical protein